jgi:predicted GIY-YIG superfamily endonuclease
MRKSRGYWINKENCRLEALKYDRISDFKKKSGGAYNSAKSNGWLIEITNHIIYKIKPVGYWSFENCKNEALKYKSRIEFKNNSAGAYGSCKENGWIDSVSGHMINIGHRYKKCVYSYEFSDNHVYVGITYNIERRKHDRKKCKTDSVTKHIKKTGITPLFTQLTDFIPVDKAIYLENDYVQKYLKDEWNILNQSKTGSVGSVKKWTKEKCIEVGKKCKTRTDFCKQTKGAYDAAYRYGWLDDVLQHIPLLIKPHGYWTKEKCENIFKKYKSIKLIKQHAITAYSMSHRNGWLNEFKKYLTNGRIPNGYWSKEKCIDLVKKCETKKIFRKNHINVYVIASKQGWLDEIYWRCGI